MENTQEKTFEQTTYEAKLNLFGLNYLSEIQKEIELVDCGCKLETEYLECVAYTQGLQKAVSIFKQLKEKQ